MTHRLFAGLLVLALLSGAALAGGYDEYEIRYGTMTVVDCEEWVSLREVPGVGGRRLARVPVGAIVTDAEWVPLYDQFIHCSYGGQTGYILGRYLAPGWDVFSGVVFSERRDGLTVTAERGCSGRGESLRIVCTDDRGGTHWTWRVDTDRVTELESVTAFMGGTRRSPRVMAYAAGRGLTALDFATGKVQWTLLPTVADLGGSISHVLAEDGTLFVGGYYGPDPVAVSIRGDVLWRAESGSADIFWLDAMELRDGDIAAHYAVFPGSESGGWLLYGQDGSLLSSLGGE